MMKRFFMVAAMAFWLLPAACLAQIRIEADIRLDGGNSVTLFSAQQQDAQQELTEEEQFARDMQLFSVNALLETRFAQARAAQVYSNAVSRGDVMIEQNVYSYQDDRLWSAGRVWQGEQADGAYGSSAACLTLDLHTGAEIALEQLFDDPEAAIAAMEAIIARDVLDGMSDYMEFADLLPMPRDCFAITKDGLMVFWPEDRYRYFSGESGSVTFAWHEIDEFIGETSPVYAVSRSQAMDLAALSADVSAGTLGDASALGTTLGELEAAYPLADPDYTLISMVYPLERVRGMAVEIDKYAETDETDTPISAIRASCIDFHGLTTGETTREQIIAYLGEPKQTTVYDEDGALDMLLEPGESLYYEIGDRILQAHLDETGVLNCLILREEIPQWYY